jgi:predicted GNAT family acetyltransferase
MATPHPLDRPVWNALTGRQAYLALGDERAVRFDSDYGLFAAAADASPGAQAALAALCPRRSGFALFGADEPAPPPELTVVERAACWQMVAESLAPGETDVETVPLTDADAPEMLALATLTRPGPFFARTHQLGDFIGVKKNGVLVAMAGERMKPAGFTEVSGVCTHPDHRGHGYAAGLSRIVASRILARGETPFLHAFATNTGAISVYKALGFSLRREITLTVLARA